MSDFHPYARGMVLMVLAMLMLPTIDAIAKWLSSSIPAGQVTWCRFALQTLFMLPLAARLSWRVAPLDLMLNALRGALLAATTLVFFAALRYLPMADAISIFFVEPLILSVLAALFLGESIRWRRISAVCAGLLGAIIVIRPNFQALGWPAMLPLAAAMCFACYLLLTRRVALRDDPARMQFFAGAFGLIAMTIVLAIGHAAHLEVLTIVVPSAAQWGLLLVLGAIASFGHLLVVHAFKRAPAAVLAPFQYLEIVGATILGWAVFGDFPPAMNWVGIATIVLAGLYVFHRERSQSNG